MRYAYVLYPSASGEWEARAPAWGSLRAVGSTRELAIEALSEKVTALAEELFCRSLPYPPEVGVEVGVLSILESP